MWTPGGETVNVAPRAGWSADGPEPDTIAPTQGWWWVPQANARDSGVGQDGTLVRPRLVSVGAGAGGDRLYMGTDPTQDFELRVPVRENGGSRDSALVRARLSARDGGTAGDLARLGVTGKDGAAGDGSAQARLLVSGRDSAGAGDGVAGERARVSARDVGAAGDSASASFSARAAVSSAYNSAAGTFTYTIPVWSRYLVLVGIGGGASGMTGNGAINQPGTGGAAGKWSSTILERGVHIPWAATSITVVVGAGGAQPPSNDWAAAVAGSATTFTASGSTVLTCAGGSGTNGGTNGGGIREGQAAGNYSVDGDTYTGGSDQPSGNGVAGNPPGGGGAGGNGGIFGSRTRGGAGARGGAWIKARQ